MKVYKRPPPPSPPGGYRWAPGEWHDPGTGGLCSADGCTGITIHVGGLMDHRRLRLPPDCGRLRRTAKSDGRAERQHPPA